MTDFKRGQIVGARMTGASFTETPEMFGISKNTALRVTSHKIAAELNGHLENPVSTKTVGLELHKAGFHGRPAIRKPLLF